VYCEPKSRMTICSGEKATGKLAAYCLTILSFPVVAS
jgi:hypothetical protein